MKPSRICPFLTACFVLFYAGCATDKVPFAPKSAQPLAPQTPITKQIALDSFDETWNTVEQSDFDPKHGGVDWIAVKVELRPQAEQATSREQLRIVLQDMLTRLKRSHFGVIPAESAQALPNENTPDNKSIASKTTHAQVEEIDASKVDTSTEKNSPSTASHSVKASHAKSQRSAEAEASFGLTLRYIENIPTVTGVADNSPAHAAGVAIGWSVQTIDGHSVESTHSTSNSEAANYVRELVLQSADAGEVESEEIWEFLTPASGKVALQMRRTKSDGMITKLGLLPPFQVRCSDRALTPDQLRALGLSEKLKIVVIAFNIWMPAIAQKLDEAFQRNLDADGLIIDLRGNPGGAGGMVMGIAGHVMDEPKSLGTMRTRDTTLEFKVNPRRTTREGLRVQPFEGPVAVVVDPLSASTSEIFAGGLQKLDRARVFGRISAGAALPAQMKSLASGDAILYAFANYTLPDGSTIEGTGVIPNEITGAHSSDWADARDADVSAAAKWISAQKSAQIQ